MATRRVFVIWSNPLFHESVRLLLNHPDVEWLGSTADHVAARGQITSLQPDIIIMEEREVGGVLAEVLEILEASSSDIRVFRLSLAGNELSVYHREHQTMGQAEDLLTLILAC
jgi:DNA-binding NarL/FixJ family response regulator